MTRRLLLARAEQVSAAILESDIHVVWQSLVAAHALRVGGEATDAILADLPLRDPEWQLDLLDDLQMDERSVLYEFSLAFVDRHSRKASGQFFTPDDVARFLAERAARFPAGTWIDPCCGVGNLSFHLADVQPDPRAFVAGSLVLVDRDPLALLIARALLATEFRLDADEYAALTARSRVADALTDDLPPYDFAILNPPYVVVPRDERFRSAEARDLYAYFIERMLERSSEGGGVVAISPQSFTSAAKFAEFRRLLAELQTMDVYCFDNVPDNVFRGVKFGSQNTNRVNSTRAAVLVGRRGAGPRRHRITPLLRWRSHERADLFVAADDFLAELQWDEQRAFPKVGAALIPLHAAMLAAETVGDLAVREATPYPLDVPVTPRYFLSAVKRVLDRGHVHRLFFPTAEARDRAYVALNSSLAYWWWRVYEGGITISKTTLASVPVPLATAPADLVAALEASEIENLVVKRNAGRPNENVKHPWRLLRRLNQAVAPDFVDALLATHANSHISAQAAVPDGARSRSPHGGRVETTPAAPPALRRASA